MELIKRLSLILLLLCTTSSLWSNGGLQFKGKLRILRPTTLQVKDLNGNLVLTCSISQNGVFETEKKEIQPDVYTLCIGKTEQNIYFENTSVSINGFFDEKNPEQSSLSFTGIDPFLTLQNYMPAERDPDKATIPTSAKEKLTSAMASALAYLADVNDYPSNKMLLDMIPEQDRNSLSAKWLINKVEVLSHQIIGAECPGFTFIDNNGKSIGLKDFRGKIVVLDRDDDDQRPEEQRQAAVDIGRGHRNGMIAGEDFLHRVQRAGADVAIDDAEGRQGQRGEARAGRSAGRLMSAHDCSLRVMRPSLRAACCADPTAPA
jgi:hypothetical protein